MKKLSLVHYPLRVAANLENRREKRSGPADADPIWRTVVFRIAERSHDALEFGRYHSNVFEASNGIVLKSVMEPHWDSRRRTLDVGGPGWVLDETHLVTELTEYHEIERAVHEYNEHDWSREARGEYERLEGDG